MNIQYLRSIGKRLFAEIGSLRLKPFASESLGKGASGDKTFPIDKKAEDIIIGSLQASGQPLSIISEEYGTLELAGGGPIVLIDPVDGSRNAVTGIPFYCTSIAVADGQAVGTISIAYVINLLTGDEFWATAQYGSFMNGERIAAQSDDVFYLIAYEAQIPNKDIASVLGLLSAARRTRCLGAIALDLAYLAYGSVSVFTSPSPSRSFDFGAGYLLVKEAGGVMSNMEGNSIEQVALDLSKSTTILASGNRRLHDKALTLLRGELIT